MVLKSSRNSWRRSGGTRISPDTPIDGNSGAVRIQLGDVGLDLLHQSHQVAEAQLVTRRTRTEPPTNRGDNQYERAVAW